MSVDAKHDLAVIYIKANKLAFLTLGNSSTVAVGEEVRAAGFPLKAVLGDSLKVTRGTLSGIIKAMDGEQVFQIDAAVNPGNSGGPLVSETGEVIGVVSARLGGSLVSNVGFAVPINYAKRLLQARGVSFSSQEMTDKLDGATLVKRVAPGIAMVTATLRSRVTGIPKVTAPKRKIPATRPPKAPDTPMPKVVTASPELLGTLTGHDGSVYSVAFSPDGKTLATSGSWDETLRLWDVQTGEVMRTLSLRPVLSVAFSPDGKALAIGSMNRSAQLWDTKTGYLEREFTGHTSVVASVAFSPTGKMLASGSWDQTVRLWDAQSGELKRTLTGHTGLVLSVAFSPDGKTLASGADTTVRLWDAQSGELERTLTGHSDIVWSVAFSPDGKMLASGSLDETVKLWDAQTGEIKHAMTRHSKGVHSVAFSSDGKSVASGADKTVWLWDAQTGELKRRLTGHSDTVWSVAFSPDGKMLASGSLDKTVKLWDVSKVK